METGLSVTLELTVPGLGGLSGQENRLILDARAEMAKKTVLGVGATRVCPPVPALPPALGRPANGSIHRKSEPVEEESETQIALLLWGHNHQRAWCPSPHPCTLPQEPCSPDAISPEGQHHAPLAPSENTSCYYVVV